MFKERKILTGKNIFLTYTTSHKYGHRVYTKIEIYRGLQNI